MKYTAVLMALAASATAQHHWQQVAGQPMKQCLKDGEWSFSIHGGPHTTYTPELFNVLDTLDVKTVFHFSTENLTDRKFSDEVIEAHKRGHVIGLRYPAGKNPNDDPEEMGKTLVKMSNDIYTYVDKYPMYVRFDADVVLGDEVKDKLKKMGMVATSFNQDIQDYDENTTWATVKGNLDTLTSQFGKSLDSIVLGGMDLTPIMADVLPDLYNYFDKPADSSRKYQYLPLWECFGHTEYYRAKNLDQGGNDAGTGGGNNNSSGKATLFAGLAAVAAALSLF